MLRMDDFPAPLFPMSSTLRCFCRFVEFMLPAIAPLFSRWASPWSRQCGSSRWTPRGTERSSDVESGRRACEKRTVSRNCIACVGASVTLWSVVSRAIGLGPGAGCARDALAGSVLAPGAWGAEAAICTKGPICQLGKPRWWWLGYGPSTIPLSKL